MPPKQRVDLDLDALAPPNKTVRLRGKVYELPGDIGIDTIIHAMQLQERVTSDDEDSQGAIEGMLEIIYDLFRACDPKFEPMPLTISQISNILGLILSGMNVSLDEAIRETLVGEDEKEEEPAEDADRPPTSRRAGVRVVEGGRSSRSRKLSPAPS